MKINKTLTAVFIFFVIITTYGETIIPSKYNNYLFKCSMLPISKAALDSGWITIKLIKKIKKGRQKNTVLLLSPGNIEVDYTQKDGIIRAIKVSQDSKQIYISQLDVEKENMFPLNNNDIWAEPISSALSLMLRENNILNYCESLFMKGVKQVKLKLKNLSSKNTTIFELFIDDKTYLKVYINNDGFSVRQYFTKHKKRSLTIRKKNIKYINYINKTSIQTTFSNGNLIVMEGIGKAKKYNKEGKLLKLPEFRIRIVK